MVFEKIKLEDNEKMIKVMRRHWFSLVRRTFGIFATSLMPPLALLLLVWFGTKVEMDFYTMVQTYLPAIIFFYAFWLLVNWMILATIWTDHYLDLFVVTDRRIIKIDQISLFRRSIGSFRLERLQDVNIEINGFIATMLNYGTVEAQTASGSEEEFVAHNLPDPRGIKAAILASTDTRMKKSRLA